MVLEPKEDINSFYNYCVKELNLTVIGLMAIPPNDKEPEKYFTDEVMKKLDEIAMKTYSYGTL